MPLCGGVDVKLRSTSIAFSVKIGLTKRIVLRFEIRAAQFDPLTIRKKKRLLPLRAVRNALPQKQFLSLMNTDKEGMNFAGREQAVGFDQCYQCKSVVDTFFRQSRSAMPIQSRDIGL
jgi:hypothetical protein